MKEECTDEAAAVRARVSGVAVYQFSCVYQREGARLLSLTLACARDAKSRGAWLRQIIIPKFTF
jgi:hypothetical protein